MFLKIRVLKNFAIFIEDTCVGVSFLKDWQLYKKKTPKQMLSCEYCDFFKSSFFYRTPPLSTSKSKQFRTYICYILFSKPFKVLKCFFPSANTAQKVKFSIEDFFSKCDQIRRKLRIWSHLLKKSFNRKLHFLCSEKHNFQKITML